MGPGFFVISVKTSSGGPTIKMYSERKTAMKIVLSIWERKCLYSLVDGPHESAQNAAQALLQFQQIVNLRLPARPTRAISLRECGVPFRWHAHLRSLGKRSRSFHPA